MNSYVCESISEGTIQTCGAATTDVTREPLRPRLFQQTAAFSRGQALSTLDARAANQLVALSV